MTKRLAAKGQLEPPTARPSRRGSWRVLVALGFSSCLACGTVEPSPVPQADAETAADVISQVERDHGFVLPRKGAAMVHQPLLDQTAKGGEAKALVVLAGDPRLSDPALPLPLRRTLVERAQRGFSAALTKDLARVGHRFSYAPHVLMTLDSATLGRLERLPMVKRIQLDLPSRPQLVEGAPLIEAGALQTAGFSGAGQTVAIVDTGIDYTHSALGVGFGAGFKVVAGYDFFNDDSDPMDDNGHGTAVAGIVASSHETYRGVAPDARLVALKTQGASGAGSFAVVDEALEWVLDNHQMLGIGVVNISITSTEVYGFSCDLFTTPFMVSLLEAQGIAVFAASGNGGCTNGVSLPACGSDAIAVGGVWDADEGGPISLPTDGCGPVACGANRCCEHTTTDADVISCYTNAHTLLDLLAPSHSTSTTRRGGGIRTNFGGTSAAAPYAAGAAALLLEVSGGALTPTELVALMKTTGTPIVDTRNGTNRTFARIDLQAAAAACTGKASLTCDDQDPCTDDGCKMGACLHTNNTAPCTAGNACLVGVCSAGSCVGAAPVDCDDENPCTNDSCDPDLGCVHQNNSATCEDNDACTSGTTCSAGSCGVPLSCNDGNVCTVDGCDPASGCLHQPADCDDDNSCTDDSCDASLGCTHQVNTAACDDGNACTTSGVCANGACQAGSPIDCDDGNPCTDDDCDPSVGCFYSVNEATCDDNSVCTENDACTNGSCTGTPIDCTDQDPCTDDTCDAELGCVFTPNSDVCDDADPCTFPDVCQAGLCLGTPRDDCGSGGASGGSGGSGGGGAGTGGDSSGGGAAGTSDTGAGGTGGDGGNPATAGTDTGGSSAAAGGVGGLGEGGAPLGEGGNRERSSTSNGCGCQLPGTSPVPPGSGLVIVVGCGRYLRRRLRRRPAGEGSGCPKSVLLRCWRLRRIVCY